MASDDPSHPEIRSVLVSFARDRRSTHRSISMKHPFATPLVVIAICLYGLLGGLSLSEYDFPSMHDDGIYAITAKSLAETGEYRIASLPGEPYQHKYPILFPAILSIVWQFWPDFPGNIVPLKAVSLSAGAIFLTFTYLLLRGIRDAGHFTAAIIVAICAFAPGTGELANNVLSELVYGAFTVVTLWLLDRELRHAGSPSMGIVIGFLCGTAYLTRSVGIALVLAMIGGLALRKNWRLLLTTVFGLALIVIPVKSWCAPVSHVGRSYEYYVNYGDWFRHTAAEVGPHFLVWVPIKNLLYSVIGLSGTMLPSRVDIFPAGNILNSMLLGLAVAGTLVILLTIVGLFCSLLQPNPPVWSLYLACYLVLLLIWPFPPPPRFFVPVLPFIILASREGLFRTGWIAAKQTRTLLAWLGLLTLLASSSVSSVERICHARIPIKIDGHYLWIRENSTPDDVIACMDDTKCYFLTGRKAVSIGIPEFASVYGRHNGYEIRTATILEMVRESRANVLIIEETRWTKSLEQLGFDAVDRLRAEYPRLLTEVWRDAGDIAVIYRVNQETDSFSAASR